MMAFGLLLLAGILLGSALSKGLALRRGTLDWPEGPVFLWWPVPPRVAIGLELSAAVVAAGLPWPAASGALVAGAYAILLVAAVTLYGRACACFGSAGGRVGWSHVAANGIGAVSAVVLGVAATSEEIPPWSVRTSIVAAVALLVGALSFIRTHLQLSSRADTDEICLADARSIRIVTVEGCPACRALRMLLETTNSRAITWHMVGHTDQDGESREDDRYPCAIALDGAGEPTCPPRTGLADAKQLVDAFLEMDLQRQYR